MSNSQVLGISLSLKQVKDAYEHFFCKPMPKHMPYEYAAQAVVVEVGINVLIKWLEAKQKKEARDRRINQAIDDMGVPTMVDLLRTVVDVNPDWDVVDLHHELFFQIKNGNLKLEV